jgi:hypothetical protein
MLTLAPLAAATPVCTPGCAIKLNGLHCGFRTGAECPRPFKIDDVNASANTWGSSENANLLPNAQQAARARCNATSTFTSLKSGGWCLVKAAGGVGVEGHGVARHAFVRQLHELLLGGTNGESAPVWSVADFGAGVGQYGRSLLGIDSRHRYAAYDGAGNVEEMTGGLVSFADMTLPITLPRADFVLSLEVGEHVPRAHEGMFVRNIHAHNACGVLISWASLNQGGSNHVNTHDPGYVRSIFEELGYVYDAVWSARMQYGYASKTDNLKLARMASWSVAEANDYCDNATFQPPSKNFYPRCKLMLLRRAVPLRRHCIRAGKRL